MLQLFFSYNQPKFKKMNNLKSIKILLFLLFTVGTLISCNDTEISTSGILSINFINNQPDIQVHIRPAENTEIVICSFGLDGNGKAEKELNIGNYYIEVSSSTYFGSTGFQIASDKTTQISWDSQNIPIVK